MSARRSSWIAHGRAVLAQSLRDAARRFPDSGDDSATAVHNARKELKKAASLARLFVPVVGGPAYATLDVVDSARRAVGRARDLDILPGVLATLKCAPATRDALMRAIAVERGKVRGAHAEIDVAGLRSALESCVSEVQAWTLADESPEPMVQSIRQTYRAAKRLGRAAWSSEDADDLHDLRIRVVDLGHQISLFDAAWPAMIAAYANELHKLRQSLGDHNDLTVLGEFALSRRELSVEAAEAVVALVLRRRKPLERRARDQFERAFSERPGAFERRLAAYLAHPHHLPAVAPPRAAG